MVVNTSSGRLNTDLTAGQEKHLGIVIGNLGTADLENISLYSTKPEGWTVTYNPDKVEFLEAGGVKSVDVTIKAPNNTIAGDYSVTLRGSTLRASDEVEIRVTVSTPTIWGWVGIAIVVLVLAGLAGVFVRVGRR
jgi:uncharacterized membrane protein